jgi:uncharacterized protein
MSEVRRQEEPEYRPGMFCWIELGTSDNLAAKNFYSQLFGWDYEDNPMGPDMVYSMIKLDGKDVGGLYKMAPDMAGQGVPPHWLSYILVTSADETVEKIKAAGATVINGPFDVGPVGRMAVVKDPTDAVFAIWEPKEHQGSGIYNVPGSFCWNELGTNDTARAAEFYSNVFGWNGEKLPESPLDYTVFKNAERGNGGMYKITPEMGRVPPHWLVYFAVDDCDAKVQKVTELGGGVVKPSADIPGVGRFAIVHDPQGAAFAIIKLENPAQ